MKFGLPKLIIKGAGVVTPKAEDRSSEITETTETTETPATDKQAKEDN